MPFIRTTTNVKITDEKVEALKADFGRDIALVSGKAECYLMVAFADDVRMAYQGDMSPCAMVEVNLLGKADRKELDSLTAAITKSIEEKLGISPNRVYVNYLEYEVWGVGGANV